MSTVRIEYNRRAFEKILRAPRTEAHLERLAERAAAQARSLSGEDGYIAVGGSGSSRERAAVVASDTESAIDNSLNHTIIRSIDAAR